MAKSKTIQAIGTFVVLDPVQENSKPDSKGGILIPESAQEEIFGHAETAVVVSAGEECPKDLVPGAVIMVLKGSCLQLEPVDGVTYLTCRCDKIVGVVK